MIKQEQRKWWKLAALIVWLAAAAALWRFFQQRSGGVTLEQVRDYLRSFGWWSPFVYGLISAQPFIPLPGSFIAMAGGLVFGLGPGLALATAAMALRAYGQFWIARWLGREAVETLLRGHLEKLDQKIGRSAFQTVFWIRVLPNVPFDIQSLSFGVSRVAFTPYAAATFLGLIPTLWLWVYLGQTLTDMRQVWNILAILVGLVLFWYIQHHVQRRRA